uniref:Uncharacterized protein n=1 Tax=Falco tinnunculus TaxID=100819 RepID=A0A8C4U5E1_FALTI
MGVSGSAPASPAAPLCRPSAHISDPRSPSAGILRTPIEVLSSPLGSPQAGPAEPLPGTGSLDSLVKQLSEAFGVGAAAPGPAPPGEACPAAESARRSSLPAGGPRPPACLGAEAGRPPSPSTVAVWQPRLAGPGFSSGKCSVRGWCPCLPRPARLQTLPGPHPPVPLPAPGALRQAPRDCRSTSWC